MMHDLALLCCAAEAALVVGLVAAAAVLRLRRGRRAQRDAALGRLYLRIVMHGLLTGMRRAPAFPCIGRTGARGVLAQVLARLASAAYGLDAGLLRRIVRTAELEPYLLRRIRRSGGVRRARYLSLLARLAPDAAVGAAVARYASDRSRSVRFAACLVQLAADPSQALRLLACWPEPLTAYELAAVASMLRRGMLPVAYEPLLASSHRNLRSLGLCIVRQFGIEEAEEALLRIAASDAVPEIGCEAVRTLCALQRPLRRSGVLRRLRSMGRAERRALLRCMAAEGYASDALPELFDRDERLCYESLVGSYKCELVCP